MKVEEAWRVPREVVNELGKFNAHVNGIKIAPTSAVRSHPEVEHSNSPTTRSTDSSVLVLRVIPEMPPVRRLED